jgi:hypothetical protein
MFVTAIITVVLFYAIFFWNANRLNKVVGEERLSQLDLSDLAKARVR